MFFGVTKWGIFDLDSILAINDHKGKRLNTFESIINKHFVCCICTRCVFFHILQHRLLVQRNKMEDYFRLRHDAYAISNHKKNLLDIHTRA